MAAVPPSLQGLLALRDVRQALTVFWWTVDHARVAGCGYGCWESLFSVVVGAGADYAAWRDHLADLGQEEEWAREVAELTEGTPLTPPSS